jgi:hypothetical protein
MKNPLHFVCILACHSEFAAKIFHEAGAKHVIGINEKFEIDDDAVLTFTQSFYTLIWN